MSTQFAPRVVDVARTIVDDVAARLATRGIRVVRDDNSAGPRLRVAPAHAADLADAIEEVRASKREEEEQAEQKRLEEARASIDVGGLSVAQAERLVSLVKDAPNEVKRQMRDGLPEDLRRALGISAPEFEATLTVRFRRSHQPMNSEASAWVSDALRHYFDDHEAYCGTGEVTDGHEAIRSVRVDEIVSVDES